MRKICAWCDKELPGEDSSCSTDGLITHGMCRECAAVVGSDARRTAADFLETLHEPVLLVDGNVRIIAANTAAQQVVSKDPSAIDDHLGGEVLECANSYLPGGCGQTVHCKACAIRNSVTSTLATGIGVDGVPALQNIRTADGVQQVCFYISTEKIGDGVLLRIDNVEK